MTPLRIAIVSAEVSPYSKTGGLADVVHALPKHLQHLGHEPVIVTPYYEFIKDQEIPRDVVGEQQISIGEHEYAVRFIRSAEAGKVPVYFIDQEELFGSRKQIYRHDDDYIRFAVFAKSVFALFETLGYAPDILHSHDWTSGLVSNYYRSEFRKDPFWEKTATVFTIHNLPFQMQGMWYEVPKAKRDSGRGAPPRRFRDLRFANFTLRGILNSDVISTVSERYAAEILTKQFGEGLDGVLRRRKSRVIGIINGIDYTVFNPSYDPNIHIHYDWNSLDKKLENKLELQKDFGLPQRADTAVIGMAHRLTEQKGFDLILSIAPVLVRQNVQLIIVGSGEKDYLRKFRQLAKKYPEKIAVHLEFSEVIASRIYAGSDMFLMPSRFEPCGISQLISLRYGSIPIVHRIGGLADTIADFDPRTGVGTGFVFYNYTAVELLMALARAIETYKYPKVWEHLTWQAMRQSFSWELPAQKYVQLYKTAIKLHQSL